MAFINGKRVLCATVNVNAGGEVIKLFTPNISISNGVMKVNDGNGDFSEKYDLYNDTRFLFSFTGKSFKLADYITEPGNYKFMVIAKNDKFLDSDLSNIINYEHVYGTPGLAYSLSTDGTHYICTGIGTATDTDIVIAYEYDGLPVTKIGSSAFRDNKNITSLTMLYPMSEIETEAFNGCSKLKTVKIPDSLIESGTDQFLNTDIDTVYINDWESWCNISFVSNKTSVGYAYGGNPIHEAKYVYVNGELFDGNLTIPESITEIKGASLSFKNVLQSVTIHDNVEIIGGYAFDYASQLKTVNISENSKINTIHRYAFSNCSSLTEITIPASTTLIRDGAFSYCKSLTSFKILATTPPTLGSGVFSSHSSDLIITVPAGCGEAYRTAAGWSTYADLIVEAEA